MSLDDAPIEQNAMSTAETDTAKATLSSAAPQMQAKKASGKKPLSAAKKRKRDALVHRWVRYGVQLVFFILAPALFSGAFNGVKYICTQIGLGDALEPTSFLIQLLTVLAFTVLFGRFFCGYACAFGTLGDYLYNAFEFVRRRTDIPRPKFPEPLVHALSLLKYVVLAGICVACFLGVWGNVASDSPWVAFAAILAGSLEGIGWVAIALLAAIVIGMIVRERFFCQFLCPLGAVFSLLPVIGASEYVRTRAHCARKCGHCHEACPVDIWPDVDNMEHGECISCGRCADVCPMANVNMVAIEKAFAKSERLQDELEKAEAPEMKPDTSATAAESDAAAAADVATSTAGNETEKPAKPVESKPHEENAPRPLLKTKENWYLLRGSEVGYVAVRAVLLLILCWLVGALRYVPPFMDVFGFNPFVF